MSTSSTTTDLILSLFILQLAPNLQLFIKFPRIQASWCSKFCYGFSQSFCNWPNSSGNRAIHPNFSAVWIVFNQKERKYLQIQCEHFFSIQVLIPTIQTGFKTLFRVAYTLIRAKKRIKHLFFASQSLILSVDKFGLFSLLFWFRLTFRPHLFRSCSMNSAYSASSLDSAFRSGLIYSALLHEFGLFSLLFWFRLTFRPHLFRFCSMNSAYSTSSFDSAFRSGLIYSAFAPWIRPTQPPLLIPPYVPASFEGRRERPGWKPGWSLT